MFLPDDNAGEADAHKLLGRASPRLVEDLQALGLYVSDMSVIQQTTSDGTVISGLQVQAVVGRVAFSARVQRPDQEAVDAQFEDLAERYVTEEFERRRRELGG
jgi:hypothetical protein